MIDNSEAVKAFYIAEAKDDIRLKYPLNKDSVVFDIGAYKGEWALEINKRYGCLVLACEPVHSLWEQLKKAAEGTQVEAYNIALGGTTRKELITVDADGSSMHLDATNRFQQETIQVKAIDEWMSTHWDYADLIKLNVEGSEYEILERLIELGWLNRFTDFQIQFHPTVPDYEKRREAIQKELYKTHWQTYNFEWVWENWRRR